MKLFKTKLIDCTNCRSKFFTIVILASFIILNAGCFTQESKINTKNISSRYNETHLDDMSSINFKEPHLSTNILEDQDTALFNQLVDGQKQGKWRNYYENGQLQSVYTFKDGLKEGIGIEWWETGKMMTFGHYKNGVLNGILKWYNENGILIATGNMSNNMRDGKWKICDYQLTTNCIEANFSKDKKIGLWKILHSNGNVWKEQKWNDGILVSEKCWDENGNKIEC